MDRSSRLGFLAPGHRWDRSNHDVKKVTQASQYRSVVLAQNRINGKGPVMTPSSLAAESSADSDSGKTSLSLDLQKPILHPDQLLVVVLAQIQSTLQSIVTRLDPLPRLADSIAPAPDDIVGTPHVAARLGCTVTWVAELVRNGEIPKSCVVPGTGAGKPWKFFRERIDQWIKTR
jgi:hypothetical protein